MSNKYIDTLDTEVCMPIAMEIVDSINAGKEISHEHCYMMDSETVSSLIFEEMLVNNLTKWENVEKSIFYAINYDDIPDNARGACATLVALSLWKEAEDTPDNSMLFRAERVLLAASTISVFPRLFLVLLTEGVTFDRVRGIAGRVREDRVLGVYTENN